jgi:hypothetical protein
MMGSPIKILSFGPYRTRLNNVFIGIYIRGANNSFEFVDAGMAMEIAAEKSTRRKV